MLVKGGGVAILTKYLNSSTLKRSKGSYSHYLSIKLLYQIQILHIIDMYILHRYKYYYLHFFWQIAEISPLIVEGGGLEPPAI